MAGTVGVLPMPAEQRGWYTLENIDWTETLKIWGSVAGLLSGLFLVVDRATSGRPRVSFSSLRPDSALHWKEAVLLIENRSSAPIMIDNFWTSTRNLKASKFEDHSDFFGHPVAKRARALINPDTTTSFPLTISEDEPPGICLLVIFWTTGSGVLPHLPVIMLLQPQKLTQIEHERSPGKRMGPEV